jgi:hypothetical protein
MAAFEKIGTALHGLTQGLKRKQADSGTEDHEGGEGSTSGQSGGALARELSRSFFSIPHQQNIVVMGCLVCRQNHASFASIVHRCFIHLSLSLTAHLHVKQVSMHKKEYSLFELHLGLT